VQRFILTYGYPAIFLLTVLEAACIEGRIPQADRN